MVPQAFSSALLAKRLLAEGVSLIEAPCIAGEWRFDAVGQDEHTGSLVLVVYYAESRPMQRTTPARALARTERVVRGDTTSFRPAIEAYRCAHAIAPSKHVRLDILIDIVDETTGDMASAYIKDVTAS